jgi:Cu2+-exporting ATPase
VSWSEAGLVVRDEGVFGPETELQTRRFLERAFGVDEVAAISVDRNKRTATVRPAHVPEDRDGFVRKLAAALRGDERRDVVLPRGVRETAFTVYRHGAMLSTCQIVVDRPGLLRLRHDALRRDRVLAKEFGRLISAVPGVTRTALDGRTGALTVRFETREIAAARLIRLAEEVLDAPDWWDRTVPPPPRMSFALANTNLAVGTAADLAITALAPVSAVLLVGSNLRTFRLAWEQVRRRQLGLPVLYTLIVGGTLASGQFLASALMSWSFKFWQDRLRHDLSGERRRLLGECLPLPRLARLEIPSGEVLASVDRLKPGDRVLVNAGEIVPADGRVIRGLGVVDEQTLRGLEGASRVRAGDMLLAGSTVLDGSLCFEVAQSVDRSRAWRISRALLAATSPAPGGSSPTKSSEAFAERAVGPTVALAGVGLLAGDVTTAAAILRADYATGPGVAVPLETVRDATACACRGIVVRSPDAFNRLAEINTVVLDDALALRACGLAVDSVQSRLPEPIVLRYAASVFRHMADERALALLAACRERRCHVLDLPAVAFDPGVMVMHGKHRVRVRELNSDPGGAGPLAVEIDGNIAGVVAFQRSKRPLAAEAIDRIQTQAGVSVILVSDQPEREVAEFAASLGVSAFLGGLSDHDKARFLGECRARGVRTAFVGDCRTREIVASSAGIAVSTSGDTDMASDHAEVVLLQPRLDLFADLHELSRSHSTRVRETQRFVIVPNALCVAGALFFGASALTVVVVSNLSTLGLYHRASGALRSRAAPGISPGRRRVAQSLLGTEGVVGRDN